MHEQVCERERGIARHRFARILIDWGNRKIRMKENMGARDDGSPSRVLESESGDPPSWMVQIESEAQEEESFNKKETDEWKKHSIYKLPKAFVRDGRGVHLYKPQVVALGPYHHRKPQLQTMEKHKERALRHVHRRTKKSVEEFRKALKEEEVLQKLMDTYKDLVPLWKNDEEEFLKMMIFDGCFMLEVMRVVNTNDFDDYDEKDPIFSYHGMLSNLSRMKRDMLMLENQIPLLVLHKLAAVQNRLIREQEDRQKQRGLYQEVNDMVLDFFQQEKMETPPSLKYYGFMRRMRKRFFAPAAASTDDRELDLHVLDVVRKSMIKDVEGRSTSPEKKVSACSRDVIWHATRLEDAGIRFKRKDSPSLKDITFQKGNLHAILSLPQLVVDDATESKFLNLMAFEHLHTGSGKEVSSYVSFMDKIIKSDKDVSLLSENNIIKNFVGTDQAVAGLFNGICYDVSIDPATDLGKVYLEVVAYCDYRFNKYRASKNVVDLKRSHLKSPWTCISLMAAILLLSLTIIQSVYTIIQYYKPH